MATIFGINLLVVLVLVLDTVVKIPEGVVVEFQIFAWAPKKKLGKKNI